jgi:gamma-glutamyltranspeptidase/glutathione hydrolase
MEGDDIHRRVPHVEGRVVTEADEGDGSPPLPIEIEPVENTEGAVTASKGPDGVDVRVVEGGLQIGEPICIRAGEVADASPSRRKEDGFQFERPAASSGGVDPCVVDGPARGHESDAGAGPERSGSDGGGVIVHAALSVHGWTRARGADESGGGATAVREAKGMTRPEDPPYWPDGWPYPASGETAHGTHAMVATTDALATAVGLDVLGTGGNAVDAAVAVSFALAVVNPEAGNLGGGGYLLLRWPNGSAEALDYRSAAPAAAVPDMFGPSVRRGSSSELRSAQGPTDARSERGHLAVAVPGSVAGLWEAHRRHGRLPWAALVEPSIALAIGFPVGERLVRSFTPRMVAELGRFSSTRSVFLGSGRPPRQGEVFRQPDLARTLGRIRDRGSAGFYGGETADLIVEEMQRGGGIVTHGDLASYRVEWRRPVRFRYRDHHVLSMPPSSSGGVTLAVAASILETVLSPDLPWHGGRHVHLLAEAWRRAFADRNHYLADPAFVAMPLKTLLSARYGAWRAADIASDVATPSLDVIPGASRHSEDSPDGSGATTHVSVVDPDGVAVSLTTTLNTWFGSKLVAAGTGVLLNNEMDDFTTTPGMPNHFGLIQGDANTIHPGKRPLSAMTPTIVADPDDRLRLVVGTPGGATIITTVFQVVSNMVDYGMDLRQAVRASRVHHQHLPDRIETEPGALPSHVGEELARIGHEVVERGEPIGDVQAIAVERDGTLRGEADPRRGGRAAGF